MRYDPHEKERQGCMWQAIILVLVVGVILFAFVGLAETLKPAANYTVTSTYNTNVELNFFSGNTDTFAAIGICVVLIMIVRTLRGGGER